ncbi:MAG: hypothetical protein R2753_02960 [Chitinophagales bacterium]
MKKIKSLALFVLLFSLTNCGDDGGASFDFQSDKCNSGQQATLNLVIDGVGTFTYTESSSAYSHASDTEGSGIDAVSMYMGWKDLVTGDSLRFDVTIENETLAEDTYTFTEIPFNGTVNFYIYEDGALKDHYTFLDWETTINEFDVYTTSSQGGFTSTRLAFVSAATSGTFREIGGSGTNTFTSTYTICPRY